MIGPQGINNNENNIMLAKGMHGLATVSGNSSALFSLTVLAEL